MVLESIIDPNAAKKHPLRLLLIGILFVSIAILFSLWIFRTESSLVMVFITVIMAVPLMYTTIEEEEEYDWHVVSEKSMLKEHSKAIGFLSLLFLGLVIAFTFWFIVLPADTVSTLYETQLGTLGDINGPDRYEQSLAVGNTIGLEQGLNRFSGIFSNNMRVLLFCIFFAFFFGAGAIFILTWNASVIGAAAGAYFRNNLAQSAASLGFGNVANYLGLFGVSILKFMSHGVFEIGAYFIGGLAGGIISIGIINHGVKSERFRYLIQDTLTLFLIATITLIGAGLIEVFVTPIFF